MLNTAREPLTSLGYQQISAFNGAAVSLAVPAGCTHIFWDAETANFRWRDDGTDPTGAVGMQVTPADGLHQYPGDPEEAPRKLRVIAQGTTTVLNITYYKAGK